MSHVATIEVEIMDLGALADACERLGFKMHMNRNTYNWYGRWMGDYPLPEGFTKEELGHCLHAISVPEASYEIGVVKSKTGRGYHLLWDFWKSGGLTQKIGEKGEKLVQAYSVEKTRREARKKGYSVYETVQADGNIKLTLKKC